MTSQEVVQAEPREDSSRGKNEARRLRASGRVPAVVYGAKKASVAVSVDPKQITRILHSASGHNTIFDLELGSEKTKAMIVDWQYEPLKGKLLHIDMKRIAMDEKIRVSVPVHLTGEAAGVKQQGGIFETVTREVEIECLPGEIPTEFRLDVSSLMIGMQLRASDIQIDPNKAKLVTEPERVIAHVVALKAEEEKPAEVAAEGAAPAEPEVIKKGKKEVEGEEGAEAAGEKQEKKK